MYPQGQHLGIRQSDWTIENAMRLNPKCEIQDVGYISE